MPNQPFVGQIMIFGGNFAPQGWALCNGQLLPINQNEALFSLLGNAYGGNGQSTFGLPNLQGRFPIHMGDLGSSPYSLGENVGVETVTLTTGTTATHDHPVMALHGPTSGTSAAPASEQWAYSANQPYGPTSNVDMAPDAVGPSGGGLPHENRPPFLVVTYCIALTGIFPSRS